MNYISIRVILDNLLTDPSMKDLSLERAVNYSVEFMKVVGMPLLFENKQTDITVSDYKGTLPSDLYEIIQVRGDKDEIYTQSLSTFNDKMPLTYKVQGNYIYISRESATLTICYNAFKVDDEGYPLILDNGTFSRALELYIQKRWFTILFNGGKIPQQVLQNIQQEYSFYVGQAQTALIRPNIDKMQSITNFMTALLPREREHSVGFKTLATPEYRKF